MARFAFALLLLASNIARVLAAASKAATDYDDAQIAADYANMKNKNPYFKNDRHTLEKLVGSVHDTDLVDLACGDGYYARHFKRLGARRVVGVDLSADMVAIGRAAEANQPLGIDYHQGECKELHVLGIPPVDVAMASYLLNYMASPADMLDTLQGIAGVLKPGGRFVGITINPTEGLPDWPKDWLQKFGFHCYGYPNGGRENVLTGGMVSCDIDKMDGKIDPIHLDTYYHNAATYEDAARKAGYAKFEWIPITAHPDNSDWPKEFFDRNIAMAFVATKASTKIEL